jgi:hypothetical protein
MLQPNPAETDACLLKELIGDQLQACMLRSRLRSRQEELQGHLSVLTSICQLRSTLVHEL